MNDLGLSHALTEQRPLYRDASASVSERVDDLVRRMTLSEKLAQLGSVWAYEIVGPEGIKAGEVGERLRDGIGQISRVSGATNLSLADAARAANDVQRHLVEHTRLGIPAIVHEECLHGVLALDAPCYPQSIGAAATFDPDWVRQAATAIGDRLLLTGARQGLAPVLDIARDPRWGRIEETYGEDPYLAASIGIAYIRGLQEDASPHGVRSQSDGVVGRGWPRVLATAKHLAGHGLCEAGLNQGPVHVGWRELRDEQLFPFEAAIVEGGLGAIMPAYSEIDGVPGHVSSELLGRVLREEWEFEGLVVSDYAGIWFNIRLHGLTADLSQAAAMSLAAGVDVELPTTCAYGEPLRGAVESGLVNEACVDRSVRRVLRAKFELGLFEHPYVPIPGPRETRALAATEKRACRELAARSLVLLKNDGVLPIAERMRRVAVIGPIAASARELLGDYSHLVHIELMQKVGDNDVFGFDSASGVPVLDELGSRRTILEALTDQLIAADVRYAVGTGIHGGTDAEIKEAAAIARDADIAIVVIGERSGLTDDSTTGEARDRQDLTLMGRQQELLEAVAGTGTPVVMVLISGRPLALRWAADHCNAILLAWVPGDEGPDAIADALTGKVSPGGKLPVTIPASVGQVPIRYANHPSGGRSNWKGDRVDGPAKPLWPFGFGMTYSRFELSDLRVSSPTIDTDESFELIGSVRNIGSTEADEVVQVYFRDEEAQAARPIRSLCGYRRVHLKPGEACDVSFRLHPEQFSYTSPSYERIVEPGDVTLLLGTSSTDLPLSVVVHVQGPIRRIDRRRHFFSESHVYRLQKSPD